MTKLIVFDLDGVLLDSSHLAYEGVREVYPTITDEIMHEVLSGNFHEGMAKLTLPRVEETEEQKRERKARYQERKLHVAIFPGIHELVVNLKARGYILAINTSAILATCLPPLEAHGIAQYFDFIGTKEISIKKTEKFTLMLNQYGLSPTDTVFVTDTLGDLLEAEFVGIPTIAVTYGAQPRIYFTREPHSNLVAIVDTVEELRTQLMSL